MNLDLNFSIHDLVGMRIAGGTPGAAQLRDMFAPFLVDELDRVDIEIDADLEELVGAAADDEDRYTETALHLADSRVQIHTAGDGFRVLGRGELLTTVLPLVDRVAVRHGAAMIHAATVDYRGQGVSIAGTGGAGKTSAVAKLLTHEDVGFMGDDWAFLAADGRLLAYPKPMLVRPHHRDLMPHLFKAGKRRKPLVPKALMAPMGRLATAVHPTLVRYPKLARRLRRWSPEHLMVTPEQAFPGARVAREVPLGAALFVERIEGATETTMERVDADWMAARMLDNFHAGLPRHARDVITALGATGLDPIHLAFAEKESLLAEALQTANNVHVRVPASLLANEASALLVAQVQEALGASVAV